MSVEYFELLGLEVKPAEAGTLQAAYKEQRTAWFLRQFQPEYLNTARKKLRQLDEAFEILRDPRKQAAIIREHRAYRRSQEQPLPLPVPPLPPTEDDSLASIHRPRVIRKLVQVAELIVHKRHRPLTDSERRTITRLGFKMGLDYSESQRLVEQIAEDAARNIRIKHTREELIDGQWSPPEET
ncbi:MAG: hypothetical protein U1D30_24525 [Planctomycetota bacterium]